MKHPADGMSHKKQKQIHINRKNLTKNAKSKKTK